MNLEQEIKEAREALEKLIAKAEKKKESMFPEIEVLDRYYSVNGLGKVMAGKHGSSGSDEFYIQIGNAFPLSQKKQAEVCAKYIKDNFWFIRKALEFADGYEFQTIDESFYVYWSRYSNKWRARCALANVESTGIYMSEQSSASFIEWLNIHKPNGV